MNEHETEYIHILLTVLQFDSYHTKNLTAFDRMFIHKKRSALISGYHYQLSKELESKIKLKSEYIAKINWKSPF